MSLYVHLERFEGPLGLLLHLIRREEMDIFDINIHEITKQYLEYIKQMKQLNLEVAGEFIAMAATLIHIKSKMLLPSYNEDGEEDETADPRRELVQRLLEYERFQEAGKELYSRTLLGRDQWARGVREKIESDEEEEILTEENALFSLISAYRFAVRQMKKSVHRVGEELQSIAERVAEIRNRLVVGLRVTFSDLLDRKAKDNHLGERLITFLSLLELAKVGLVRLFQAENFGEIHIETQKEITAEALTRVEEYDAAGAHGSSAVMAVGAEDMDIDGPMESSAAALESARDEDSPESDSADSPESDRDARGLGLVDHTMEEAATDEEILAAERELEIFDEPLPQTDNISEDISFDPIPGPQDGEPNLDGEL